MNTVSPTSVRRRRSTRGVTLLEVLVAMGIMVVGLMGMASLIPLGRLEMAEGEKSDASSTIGRWAFREVVVRGYLQPDMWADPLTGGSVLTSTCLRMSQTGTFVLPPNGPLVIDPLMIAPTFYGETVLDSILSGTRATHRQYCSMFPYSISLPGSQTGWPERTAPKLARVTLRTYPSSISDPSGLELKHTMRYDAASRFFRGTNDLVLDIPNNRTLSPIQVFATTTTQVSNLTLTAYDGVKTEVATVNAAYRRFKGDYSWFFIVEPSLAENWSSNDAAGAARLGKLPMLSGPGGSPYAVHQYRVWTVVCHKRDLRDTSGMNLGTDRNVGERTVFVDFIDRSTARLRSTSINDERTAKAVLGVKPGQWIAVTGRVQNDLLPGGFQVHVEWYRVVSAANQPKNVENSTDWYLEVMLAGREFFANGDTQGVGLRFEDASNYQYQGADAPLGNNWNPPTGWGTIVTGVCGVYEKSVFVDRPSLWAPME